MAANGVPRPSAAKVPRSAISRAASRNPPQAARANADSAHPEIRQFRHGREVTPDEHVERFGSYGCDHHGDLVTGPNSRGVETVRTRLRVGREAPDRLPQVRPSDDEPLRAPDQHDPGARCIDRRARGTDPLRRQLEIDQGPAHVSGGILDRQPRNASRHCQHDVGPHLRRLDGEPAFEVGIDGQVYGVHHRAEVCQCLLERNAVVGSPERPGVTGAGRGEGRKAQPGEEARAAEVPGIGHDETAGLVQPAKHLHPLSVRAHRGVSALGPYLSI